MSVHPPSSQRAAAWVGWMRVGSLSGKNVIYRVIEKDDFQGLTSICVGDILLSAGEKLLAVLPDQRIVFYPGWSSWSGDASFPSPDGKTVPFYYYDGPGSLYITDARTVFLRRPDLKQIRRSHDRGYASLPLAMARRILSANALEYCEIRHEDVVKYKEKKGRFVNYLMVDQQRYLFVPSKEAGEVLLPNLKKRLLEF